MPKFPLRRMRARRLQLQVAITTLGATAITACLLGVSSVAMARTPFETGYTKAQAYSAALRHLRVDLGQEVYEKDPDAAYLLFRFVSQGTELQASNGSIEIITVPSGCRVVIQLAKLPSYYEQTLKDSLLEKLRGDYGTPEVKKPQPPKSDKEAPKDPKNQKKAVPR